MSLTANDLLQIRTIVTEVVDNKLVPVLGELEAQGNDIKTIYSLLDKKQSKTSAIAQYRKLKTSIDGLSA